MVNTVSPPVGLARNLMGLAEIAMRAGVQKSAVANWRVRHDDFPEAVIELASGPVFWWPGVEAWLLSTDRDTTAGWTLDQVSSNERRRARRKQSAAS